MPRKEYTAISFEPNAARSMRAIRRSLSATLGRDISLSDAARIAEYIVVGGGTVRDAATIVLGVTA